MALKTTDIQAWKPQIDLYIDDEITLLADQGLDTVFTVKGSDRLQINEVGISGYQPMQEVGELGDAISDQAVETYSFSYQPKVFRKQTIFSSDVLQTDQLDIVEKTAKKMVDEVKYSRNLYSFGIFRNAFNTAKTFGDAKPVVSTAHPRKDGNGTQTNTFADGVQRDLTYDAVKLLEDQLYAQVSNVGNLLHVGNADRNKTLIVPYALRELAFQIAGVNGPDGKPLTADHDLNYFRKGTKFNVLVLDFLGYEAAKQAGEVGTVTKTSASNYWDSMWFVADTEVMKKYFKVYYRNGYEKFDSEKRLANESMIYYAYDKYAFGTSGWFGMTGSKGDNSTYAG